MTPEQIRSFDWYHGNLDWLPSRTIFLAKSGSHAYHTNTPTSDLDIKGVVVAPKEYYLGFVKRFEQADAQRDELDYSVMEITKFFKLAADCNPNVIEQLWVDEGDWYLPYRTSSVGWATGVLPIWHDILEHRHLFLSKKANHTFSRYAAAQLKRIRSHRNHLLHPPTHKPTRQEFGLPEGQSTLGKEQLGVIEARLRKASDELGGKGFTKDAVEGQEEALVTAVCEQVNLTANLIPVVLAERRYNNACRTWSQYQTWKTERNEKRSELEAKFGYDTKHGMHLVRLLRMAREILEGRGVIVKRPDAEELLEIRNGAWSFEKMYEWAQKEDAALQGLYETSTLPHEPDRAHLDQILVDVIEEML